MALKKLPIGVEDFEKMRRYDYYYVDKTGMITELLNNLGEVNLFTRPRRFGKSLNMSMLKSFFEPDTDKSIFEGLAVRKETALCERYMGKYPVISLSLKQVYGLDFESAKQKLWFAISMEAIRYRFLEESDKLSAADKSMLFDIQMQKGDLSNAILQLARLLCTHYEQKVIILIDEYDVPLQKAEAEGYYRKMVGLISQFFGTSMKTNPYMEFAVVTGCLRISKESIFTGFNNPKIHTITDERYDEWFGFTDIEVREMLAYYGREEQYPITKEWYDGYLFGKEYVYCPWDVVNWCDVLINTSTYIPQNFWANSSGNQMIHRFAQMADADTREQLGQLLEGKSIWKKLNFEVTYDEIDSSIEHLWSVLFMTGYLTYKCRDEEGLFELVLPNKEITGLFSNMVDAWFTDKVLNNAEGLKEFTDALNSGNEDAVEDALNDILEDSVSYLDGGKIGQKENFYHGLLVGMLKSQSEMIVRSNREAGTGRLDIVMYPRRCKRAIIFELKYVKEYKDMDDAAETALNQIKEKNYDSYFEGRTPEQITHYGIAFCRKRCRVLKEIK